jgi:hypothetical protein
MTLASADADGVGAADAQLGPITQLPHDGSWSSRGRASGSGQSSTVVSWQSTGYRIRLVL